MASLPILPPSLSRCQHCRHRGVTFHTPAPAVTLRTAIILASPYPCCRHGAVTILPPWRRHCLCCRHGGVKTVTPPWRRHCPCCRRSRVAVCTAAVAASTVKPSFRRDARQPRRSGIRRWGRCRARRGVLEIRNYTHAAIRDQAMGTLSRPLRLTACEARRPTRICGHGMIWPEYTAMV